jgi:TRAP-type C4-dicarboxylate transport system substrate-binding protein
MSWADAQPALASGAVDGQENPMFLFTVLKMHTVGQKFVTTWGYVADPLIFVVNKDIWASWTPADQAIVRQAAIDAGKQEIAIARKGLVEADKPLLQGSGRHGRDGDQPVARRARCLRQGDAPGLRRSGSRPSAPTW